MRVIVRNAGRVLTNFEALLAMSIALAATTGAIVALLASFSRNLATDLDQRATQETVQADMQHFLWADRVNQDLRFAVHFHEHIQQWWSLEQDFEKLDRDFEKLGPDFKKAHRQEKAALDLRAQLELALARSMYPFFRAQYPDLEHDQQGNFTGNATYDEGKALRLRKMGDNTLRELRPEETRARADWEHAKAVSLVRVEALFITSLLFLTLAEVNCPPVHRAWAAVGWVMIGAAFVLWLLVARGIHFAGGLP